MPDRFSEEYSVDKKKDGFVVDMRPTTLLEQSQHGLDRINRPVGEAITEGAEYQTTGGRNLTDAEAASRLGANGRKK